MKIFLFLAVTLFGMLNISYGYEVNPQDNSLRFVQESIKKKEFYFQRENYNFWISSDSLIPIFESVDGVIWVKSQSLNQNTECESCSVSSKVNGVGEQSCSVSCPKGSTPVCLPAEFGVRPTPKCYCK